MTTGRTPVDSEARSLKFLGVSMTIICIAFFMILGLGMGCKKKPRLDVEAVNKAKAEYQCDDVTVEEKSGSYIKLNVCGKVRWYKCKGT